MNRCIAYIFLITSLCLLTTCGVGGNEQLPQKLDKHLLDIEEKALTALIESSPDNDLIRKNGRLHIEKLQAEAIKTARQFSQPSQPSIEKKEFSGGDTSDARYFDGLISGKYEYRLHGTRGSAPLIEFTVYDGKFGLHKRSKQLSYLTEEKLQLSADNTFEIILSKTKPVNNKNWLPLSDETRYILIRQYSHDWRNTKSASFHIERTDNTTNTDISFSNTETIAFSALFVRRLVQHWKKTVDLIRLFPANRLIKVPHNIAQTMPAGHRFAAGEFFLEDAEVLVIEFSPPKAPYWGFQLTNYWFEPIDFGETGSHFNNKTASINKDGNIQLVISHLDIGACNWVRTRNHHIGTMQFRLSRSMNQSVPDFRYHVISTENARENFSCQQQRDLDNSET
jgi:hypothetical protein